MPSRIDSQYPMKRRCESRVGSSLDASNMLSGLLTYAVLGAGQETAGGLIELVCSPARASREGSHRVKAETRKETEINKKEKRAKPIQHVRLSYSQQEPNRQAHMIIGLGRNQYEAGPFSLCQPHGYGPTLYYRNMATQYQGSGSYTGTSHRGKENSENEPDTSRSRIDHCLQINVLCHKSTCG